MGNPRIVYVGGRGAGKTASVVEALTDQLNAQDRVIETLVEMLIAAGMPLALITSAVEEAKAKTGE